MKISSWRGRKAHSNSVAHKTGIIVSGERKGKMDVVQRFALTFKEHLSILSLPPIKICFGSLRSPGLYLQALRFIRVNGYGWQ